MPDAPVPGLADSLRYAGRLALLIRGHWGRIAAGMLLGVVVALISMVTPLLTKAFVDDVYPARDVNLLQMLVIGVLAIAVTSALVGALRSYFMQAVGSMIDNAASLLFFNHLQHQPVSFFDSHRIGEMTSRFGDLRGSLGGLSRMFETVLMNGLYLVLVPPFLLLLNWRLALLALAALPITTTVSVTASRRLRRYWKRVAETHADFNAIQFDALSNVRTLKLAAAERATYLRAYASMDSLLQLQLRGSALRAAVAALNTTLKAAGVAVYTSYAWTLLIQQRMTLGEFLAFSAYLGFLTGPVTQVASLFSDFQQSSVSLGRVFEYLDSQPEVEPSDVFSELPAIKHKLSGSINVQGVSFAYPDQRNALTDVSCTMAEDSVTAIVGPSGSGKSTLVRLLCGLDAPVDGQILFGEDNLRTVPLRDLRRQLAAVWQEVGLFRGTILENLTIGLEGATRESVDRAVEICRLQEVLAGLPKGLDTSVAEWGASLSGGQRQRVALARALIRNTRYLILDEATSSVDGRVERAILTDILGQSDRKTTLLITHRVATAARADALYILDAGRIIDSGTHERLIGACALYRSMYDASSDVLPIPSVPGRRAQPVLQ